MDHTLLRLHRLSSWINRKKITSNSDDLIYDVSEEWNQTVRDTVHFFRCTEYLRTAFSQIIGKLDG